MDLNEIVVFAHVVRAGSFTGAARDLGMPKSTVSRKVSELEERLGARLLHRTTRKLSLTDVGQAYYRHAARVVSEVGEAELVVGRMQEVPRGLLRVTTPLNFAYLGPMAATFLAHYPEVDLEVVCADRVIDLIEEGFDVAVRAGHLADSSLIARNLGTMSSLLVASPDFIDKHGQPGSPHALESYDTLAFGTGTNRSSWQLYDQTQTVSVDIEARYIVNDFDMLRQAVLTGLGVALLPVFLSVEDLRAQRLVRVLPNWCSPSVPLHAVYPSTRHLSPKVKAFLDHLREQMTPPPWELGPAP